MTIMKRGRTFHLRKRVPVQYQDVEPRKSFYVSLHTDSETVARQKAPALWQQQIEIRESLQAGDTTDAMMRLSGSPRRATSGSSPQTRWRIYRLVRFCSASTR